MKRSIAFTLVLLLALVPLVVNAHILKLLDGRILKGELISATSQTVLFHVEGDTIQEFSVGEILSIHFSSASITATPPPKAEPVKIEPGTVIRIKTTEELGTRTSSAGDRFFAELAEDLVVDGVTLAPAGKRVFCRVRKVVKPKRPGDRSVIEIIVSDLTISGNKQPVVTDYLGVEQDDGTFTFLGDARPVGATIATFFDDQHITIPAGTVFDFHLAHAVTIR
jgi:hypothetical protein